MLFLIFPSICRCICIAHTGSFLVWETAVKCNPKKANSWRWVMYKSCVLAALWKVHPKSNSGIWNGEFLSHISKHTLIWIGLVWFGLVFQGGISFPFPQSKWVALNILSHFDTVNRDSVSESELTKSYQFTLKELLFLAYIHLFSFLCFFLYHFFLFVFPLRCPNEFTGDRCQNYVMASFYSTSTTFLSVPQ